MTKSYAWAETPSTNVSFDAHSEYPFGYLTTVGLIFNASYFDGQLRECFGREVAV
jgi:hypothetical protein